VPRIDSYHFGEIVIDGKTYRNDIIILPERIIAKWWRKEGHSLAPDDLTDVIGIGIGRFIMGCGAYGLLHVPDLTREYLKENGIELIALPSKDAVEEYNVSASPETACGIHLTC
jgi:hypothetical protein